MDAAGQICLSIGGYKPDDSVTTVFIAWL